MKRITIALLVAVGILLYIALGEPSTKPNKPSIVASFYPLYEFTLQIVKDQMSVENMTPPGTEPHDFDPSPKDVAKIYGSKILIVNGANFEPWAKRIEQDLLKQNIEVVDISTGMTQLEGFDENGNIGMDPHYWLDPINVISQIEQITNAVKKVDPENSAYYESNSYEYKEKLKALDKEFKEGLKNCATRTFITSHQAFSYLAQRYNLKMVGISGISPSEEPSPQKMAEIVTLAKKNNIKHIYFESLVNPKLAETIANELGGETLVLNPIEGLTSDELNKGLNYITLQKENLNNLRIGLRCK